MNLRTAALVLLALASGARAEEATSAEDQARAADVRRLLAVMHADRTGMQVVATMSTSFKKMHPDVPEAVWNELFSDFRGEDLIDLIVPIYMKYLTAEDVRGLLAFYETPIGQKLLSVQPQILQDSMSAGQAWGQEIARRFMKKLKDKGYAPTVSD